MRILYLVTKSSAGGAQTHISQLAGFFIGKGVSVAVMSWPGGWLEGEVKKLGSEFYSNRFLSNTPCSFRVWQAIREIKKAAADFQPDLISCHSTAAGFLGRLAIKNRVPTIFTAHGWSFAPDSPFLRRLSAFLAEKIVARYCQKIICVSEFDKELALKYKTAPKEKLVVIHNGVEAVGESPEAELGSVGGSPQQSQQTKIVFVGRLNRQKDPMLLLRAFNELDEKLKEKSQLTIAGEGPKRKKIEEFILKNSLREKVEVLGQLPRDKVFEALKSSRIFVLASNWEGLPRSILEAMSLGLAVIASDVGGVREIIDENCGILVKKGDREALKTALKELLTNPELMRKMGSEAQKRVRKKFSLEEMFEKTEEVYDSLLKNS